LRRGIADKPSICNKVMCGCEDGLRLTVVAVPLNRAR
jgi:hypothetical protein